MVRLDSKLENLETAHLISKDAQLNFDLISCFIGEKLGSGCYRDVYVFNLNPNYVIKIEREGNINNMNEALIWDTVSYFTKDLEYIKKWFAPVDWISPCGRILVMRRTYPNYKKSLPKEVPAFLYDCHAGNFGWIKNQFVCHDYAFVEGLLAFTKRMKKVNL